MSIQLVDLATLYPLVSTDCPGLNENSAIDHLRWAARSFCMETHVSQDEVETDITATDPTLYVQSNSSHLVLHRIFSVSAADRILVCRTAEEMDTNGRSWRSRTGQPTTFIPGGVGEVRLVPIPEIAESGIIVRASFFPSRTTTKVDKQVADRYAEILASGALSRILRLTRQPWTDIREADRQLQQFNIDTSRCRPHGQANQALTSTRSRIRTQF